MSGGFNFGQASTGFPSGVQKPPAAAPVAGFGLTGSTPAASGGGFTFGTPTQTSTNTAGTFGFGTPAKSTAAGGGPSFGAPASTFGLGSAPQTTPASGPIFGSTISSPAGSGFSLGSSLTAPAAATPAGGGFTFGTASQAPTQPAATNPTAPATTVPGGLSFGAFSFGATKVQVTTAATVTAAPAAAPTAAPIAGPGGGFTFGSSAPSNLTLGSQPASSTTAAASTTGQGGGFSFGIKPSTTPAPPASTQAAPSGPSLFAAPVTTAAAAAATGTGFTLAVAPTTAAAALAPATSAVASGGHSFMLKPLGAATTTSTPAPLTTASAAASATSTGAATGFTLGLKPAAITSATATTTATTAIATTAAPPVMTYAQLEGLINKWSLELEDQERHFLQQATQVNAWDRMLVENGEKITALHKEMEKVKLDQRRLNQELDFILSQQKELEDLLCPLEESVKEQSGTIYMQNADEERERTYKLAENVDAQLKRMSQDLKEIIEHLNTSSGPADTSDPLQQICKILNAHMDSLQWIDQNSVLLQRRVEEVSKQCDNQRKEQEKTFRLTFD
ncbi:uncharacterized protein ACBR49_005852 [Aulostomus maculatus]